MKDEGERDLPALLAHRLLGWKARSGTYLAPRKQWASGFFEPFTLDAFGSLGKPPHLQSSRLAESSNASEPMFAYEDREVAGEKRGWRDFWSDRGERERGCGRPTGKLRLKHGPIGHSRERVARGHKPGRG